MFLTYKFNKINGQWRSPAVFFSGPQNQCRAVQFPQSPPGPRRYLPLWLIWPWTTSAVTWKSILSCWCKKARRLPNARQWASLSVNLTLNECERLVTLCTLWINEHPGFSYAGSTSTRYELRWTIGLPSASCLILFIRSHTKPVSTLLSEREPDNSLIWRRKFCLYLSPGAI